MRISVLLLSVIGFVTAGPPSGSDPEVVAPIGRIRGTIIKSRLDKDIYSFRGVRYAEPPTGQQRFQVAIPAADWTDVFDAKEEGPACPNLGGLEEDMSEDCLRLNVYTTNLPKQDDTVKRPVVVFFHPGGFYTFSGQSLYFGPQYLMDHDIVLVTVNYRLGTLGFISTGDSLAPGNLGLKDQVIALRWVKRNIAAFGGDPDSVTISGYSVGGLSVILHMVSPMSKDLFHRAIAMSGSIMVNEPFPTEQKHLAKKQAELLDCPTDTTGSMLICLNSKPVQNFTSTMSKFFEWYGDPILVWKPVVEPEVQGVERFLPAQPVDLIRQGKFNQVPLISGITKDEFGGVLVAFETLHRQGNDSLYREVDKNWEQIAPISFIYERDTARSKHISRELRRFYFGDEPISHDNSEGIAHIYADSIVIFPTHRIAQLIAKHSKQPVYFYMFTYKGRYSFVNWNDTDVYGVVHHDDLQYLFFISARFPFFGKSDPETEMVKRYTSMWSSFIETGEPIPKGEEIFANVTWDRYVPEKDNYLEINLEPIMKTGVYPERMAFNEQLFPIPPLPESTTH